MNTALAIADAFHAIVSHPNVTKFTINRELGDRLVFDVLLDDFAAHERVRSSGPFTCTGTNIVQVRLALEAIVAKLPKA